MADYKRMVSYMYQYEGGVKKKNVGFARIEAKDGQCKITLHMQLLGQLDSIFPTYLIQRGKGRTELINIGDTLLKNQVMDSKLTADEKNIMASGYGLSDMGGLLLFLNDNVFFATEWDDKPITAAEVLEALRPKHKADVRIEKTEEKTEVKIEEKRIENEETVLSLEEELALPKYKLPRGYKIIERMQKPEVTVAKADRNYSETQKLQEILEGSISEGAQEMLEASVSEGVQEMLVASVSEGVQEMLEDSASEGVQEMLEVSTSEGLQAADYNIDFTIEDQNGMADFETNDLNVSDLQSQGSEEESDNTEVEQPDPKACIIILFNIFLIAQQYSRWSSVN